VTEQQPATDHCHLRVTMMMMSRAGSQWSDCRTGVMCSVRRVQVLSRVAAFWSLVALVDCLQYGRVVVSCSNPADSLDKRLSDCRHQLLGYLSWLA